MHNNIMHMDPYSTVVCILFVLEICILARRVVRIRLVVYYYAICKEKLRSERDLRRNQYEISPSAR